LLTCSGEQPLSSKLHKITIHSYVKKRSYLLLKDLSTVLYTYQSITPELQDVPPGLEDVCILVSAQHKLEKRSSSVEAARNYDSRQSFILVHVICSLQPGSNGATWHLRSNELAHAISCVLVIAKMYVIYQVIWFTFQQQTYKN
jgi:hypothetical protein